MGFALMSLVDSVSASYMFRGTGPLLLAAIRLGNQWS